MLRDARGFLWFLAACITASVGPYGFAQEDYRSASHGLSRMETSRPLVLLSGHEAYANWSRAACRTPVIQRLDLQTGRVVWQHALGNARVMSMHLLRDRLVYVQEVREQPLVRVAWLTRATGEFVAQFETPLAPDELEPVRLVGDQVLISERHLHDGTTGQLVRTLPTINRLCSAVDGSQLIDLVPTRITDHARWTLRSFDLTDGRLMEEVEWNVASEQQADLVEMPTMVLAHAGIVVLQVNGGLVVSTRGDGIRFLGLNRADATVRWTAATPLTAPVAWTDADGRTIRLVSAERRFLVRPIQVAIASGERRPLPEWSAPSDLLTWYTGQRSIAQYIRRLGSSWVGSLRSISGANALILTCVDDASGALSWSVTHPEIAHPVQWIEETSDSPRWLVFVTTEHIQVISTENGRQHLRLDPESVGLEGVPPLPPTSVGQQLAESEEPSQSVTPLLLTGGVILAILVAGTGFATSHARRRGEGTSEPEPSAEP